MGEALTDALCPDGMEVRACLAELAVDELIEFGADGGLFGAGWAPHIDGEHGLLSGRAIDLVAAGTYNKGEIIMGTNLNEWRLFTAIGDPGPTTIAAFTALIEERFGLLAPSVLSLYAPEDDAGVAAAYIDLMTDTTFRCPTRTLARATSAQGSEVFLYSFEVPPGFHALEARLCLRPREPGRNLWLDQGGSAGHFDSSLLDAVREGWKPQPRGRGHVAGIHQQRRRPPDLGCRGDCQQQAARALL